MGRKRGVVCSPCDCHPATPLHPPVWAWPGTAPSPCVPDGVHFPRFPIPSLNCPPSLLPPPPQPLSCAGSVCPGRGPCPASCLSQWLGLLPGPPTPRAYVCTAQVCWSQRLLLPLGATALMAQEPLTSGPAGARPVDSTPLLPAATRGRHRPWEERWLCLCLHWALSCLKEEKIGVLSCRRKLHPHSTPPSLQRGGTVLGAHSPAGRVAAPRGQSRVLGSSSPAPPFGGVEPC